MKNSKQGTGKSIQCGIIIAMLAEVLLPSSAQPNGLTLSASSAPIPYNQLPRSGTFWLANGPNGLPLPPFPCLPPSFAGAPIYSLGNRNYLVDNSGGESTALMQSSGMAMAMTSSFDLPTLPTNSPSGPFTNSPSTNTPAYVAPAGILNTTGSEGLLVDTLPATPDPTQVFPSWATIHSGGIIVTTNGLIDTNASPSLDDGMPAGTATGVAVTGSLTNAITITRGRFYVLLTNSSGELENTRFEIKVMRNTDTFTGLFNQEMAMAEYDTNSTNVTLTAITGTSNSNLYALDVQFPPCVLAAQRVISIRTEPVDFDIPFSKLQWLMATNGTTAPATYTADQSGTNLLAQTGVPAMRLWGLQVNSVGVVAGTGQTPQLLHLFTIPGTVLTTYTNFPNASSMVDFIWPDEMGFGETDMSLSSSGFYSMRVDGDY